jgi:CxxC-x17-CxxC domain-containing protein
MAFNRSPRNNDSRGQGRSYGGDRPRFNDRGGGRSGGRGGDLQLFDVTCANCGKETQVPFKPTGERPVLCRDCFTSDSGPTKRPMAPSGGGSDLREDIREINEKLDRILALLEDE